MDKYRIELDYAYLMDNVLFYSEDDVEPNSIILCIRVGSLCVSSIELLIINNNDGTILIKIKI